MRKLLNQIAIFWYSCLMTILPCIHDQKTKNKKIVVFFPQQLGDALLFSEVLQQLSMMYPKTQGYVICFIASNAVNEFLRVAVDISSEISFIDFNKDRLFSNFNYYREFYSRYLVDVYHIIVPNPSNSGVLIGRVCNSQKKTIVINSCKKNLMYRIFLSVFWKDDVLSQNQLMVFQLYQLLLNKLGNKDYCSHIPVIKKMKNIIKGRYCVLHPGASLYYKVWPIERYLQIANYLTCVLGYDVFLCGDISDIDYGYYVEENANMPYKIKNYIGKTSYEEWIRIIQGANLVVGNDSASIHIAAASGISSIVICGLYDKGLFFPYIVNRKNSSDIMPICLAKEMECCLCRNKRYTGYGNKACFEKIQAGKVAVCVEKILVDDVINAIHRALNI